MYITYALIDKVVGALVDFAVFAIGDETNEDSETGQKIVKIVSAISKVAKLFLKLYAPKLSESLSESAEADAVTREFINEIRQTHADLADRHRVLFEEITDQYHVNIIGDINTANDHLRDWVNHSDPKMRMDTVEGHLFEAVTLSANVQAQLQAYISNGISDERAQFERLQLLPLHIEATRLHSIANRHYWNWKAIKTTFYTAHGETASTDIFNEWRDSLSPEELDDIQELAKGEELTEIPNFEEVLRFYERLSARDDVSDYVETLFTPLVGHTEIFSGNPNMYDNKNVVNNEANWENPDEPGAAVAQLDGARWYYYVDVPSAECLEGYAYRHLSDRHYPWAEDPDNPSQSDCNRFWIVNPHAMSTADPDYYRFRASLDGYHMWFSNSTDIYNMHKQLVKGDFLLVIYGPISLILDAMYTEIHGGERPANRWDDTLARYFELVGLFDAGRSFDEAVEASEALLELCDVSPENPGIFTWSEMLRMEVANPLNPPICPDRFEENNTWEQAALIQPGNYNHMFLNVPGDIDYYKFELFADNSVLIDLQYYDEAAFTSPPIVELWGQLPGEEEPSLIKSASEHEDYGLSVVLPSRSGYPYRHRKMTAFAKVYSPENQTGEYAIAIQTKGMELEAFRAPDSEDSGLITQMSAAINSISDDTEDSGLITQMSAAINFISDDTEDSGLIPQMSAATSLIDDDIPIVRETDDEPHRIEPEATEESESELLVNIYRIKSVKSTIYTGGSWITDYWHLNQTADADIDRYVVEVSPGLTLEICVVPSNPDFGMPYAELEDWELMQRATVDYSHWPEAGHTIRIRNTEYGARDIYFKVCGLYSNNYRRDTGNYTLTVTIEGNIGIWYGLSVLQRAVSDEVVGRIPSHYDVRALEKMYVELNIVKGPDNPGDPYVLAAIDYSTGSVISYYEFDASKYKSDLPFRTELKAFNKAQMGQMTKILKQVMKPPRKFATQ